MEIKPGDWVTPNPEFKPTGNVTMGNKYLVIKTVGNDVFVTNDCGGEDGWWGECFIKVDPTVPMPDLEFTLDEIHKAQEVFTNLRD